MSATSVKLLQAAAEIAGGEQALASRLAIDEGLLSLYMSDRRELPDVLLLRAVDMIVDERRSRTPGPGPARAGRASPGT